MGRKQVVIVTLLIIAIVLSASSVLMNVSVMNDVEFTEAPAEPETPDISLVISPPETTLGGTAG